MVAKLQEKLKQLVTNSQHSLDKLIYQNLRKNNETSRDVLQELSELMQKIAALVVTQKSDKITIRGTKTRKQQLTRADWESDSNKRRLSTRHTLEEMLFLDNHVGFGKRATLLQWLLREFMQKHRQKEFKEIMVRQKKLEEEQAADTT